MLNKFVFAKEQYILGSSNDHDHILTGYLGKVLSGEKALSKRTKMQEDSTISLGEARSYFVFSLNRCRESLCNNDGVHSFRFDGWKHKVLNCL